MCAYYAMVDERCEGVSEKDREHHTLSIARVEQTHDDADSTDEEAVNPLAALGLGCCNRVGSHKDCTECKATHYQMVVARNVGKTSELCKTAHAESTEH